MQELVFLDFQADFDFNLEEFKDNPKLLKKQTTPAVEVFDHSNEH